MGGASPRRSVNYGRKSLIVHLAGSASCLKNLHSQKAAGAYGFANRRLLCHEAFLLAFIWSWRCCGYREVLRIWLDKTRLFYPHILIDTVGIWKAGVASGFLVFAPLCLGFFKKYERDILATNDGAWVMNRYPPFVKMWQNTGRLAVNDLSQLNRRSTAQYRGSLMQPTRPLE